ncbi:MAG: hypothetical protein LBI95_01455 [Holosporales bacterium]|jgi:hypothetical protein|nr:hypothetical protein [Holosporales bacterium]
MPLSNVISDLQRIVILAKLINVHCNEPDLIRCVKLAKDLASIIDELEFVKFDFSEFNAEFHKFFPARWEKRTKLLSVITEYWTNNSRKIEVKKGGAKKEKPEKYTFSNFRQSINKKVSMIEEENIFTEIDSIIDIMKSNLLKKISIISPNETFSYYLSIRLGFEKIDYVSYTKENNDISEKFISDIRSAFQEMGNDANLKRIAKELSSFVEIKKEPKMVSIFGLGISDFPNSDIVILTELNEVHWRPKERGDYWLHSLLRQRLNIDSNFGYVDSLFYRILSTYPRIYMLRSKSSNGQTLKKSSILAKFEAICKKEHIEIENIPPMKTPSFLQLSHEDIYISSAVFKKPNKIKAKDIELLLKDSYAFYAKEILQLKATETNQSKKNLSFMFKCVIEWYSKNRSKLNILLSELKETNFFGYQKCLNILNWLDENDACNNFENIFFGEAELQESQIVINGYCDRLKEIKGHLTLVSYQTKSFSAKEITSGYTSIMPICLIAKNGGFKEHNKPIKKIQIWNMSNLGNEPISITEIEISEDLIDDFKKKLTSLFEYYFENKESLLKLDVAKKLSHDRYKHFKRSY